jgi:hypothetical protein
MLDAEQLGIETQRRRIAGVVETLLRTVGADDTAKITALRSQITALSEEPDPEMIESIMNRFPMLPDDARKSVRRDVQSALQDEKGSFLYQLRLYGDEVSKGQVSNVSLKEWWNATKAYCDYLVSSCRVE